jgi:hypothetical protein
VLEVPNETLSMTKMAQAADRRRFNFISLNFVISDLRSLEVAFPPHDSSDAVSNPAEVVEFLRTEKFREQVLWEGL